MYPIKRTEHDERQESDDSLPERRSDALRVLQPKPVEVLLGRRLVRSKPRRRAVARWLLALACVALFATAIGVPAYLWWAHAAAHVTSRNAAVRAHLAEVGTRLKGVVERVAVDVGDEVQAGQVLVRLQSAHLTAEVAQARAAIVSLESSLQAEQVAIDEQEREIVQRRKETAAALAAAEAVVEAARLQVADAERNYQQQRALYENNGIVAGSKLREAEFRWRTEQAQLQEAQAKQRLTSQELTKELRRAESAVRVRKSEAKVLQARRGGAQARVERARADLEAATIRAPRDGVVVRRIVQPGVSVEPGQPLLAVQLGKEMWVEAWIEEDEMGFVHDGKQAVITFPAYPEREFVGTVFRVGVATDVEMPESAVPQPRSTRMRGAPVLGVWIRLARPPAQWVPGMSAVVAIARDE